MVPLRKCDWLSRHDDSFSTFFLLSAGFTDPCFKTLFAPLAPTLYFALSLRRHRFLAVRLN